MLKLRFRSLRTARTNSRTFRRVPRGILHAAGVDFAGRIAPEIQFVQTFSAAVVAGSGEIEGSKRLIEFLASARAFEAIRDSGMEPLATSR